MATGQDGEWYFEWGPGSTATCSNGQVGNTIQNLTTGTTGSYSLTGLDCGTNYHYRAVSKNGNNTAAGNQENFATKACTSPVMAGVTIVTDETSQSTNEDTSKDFALTVTDKDPDGLTLAPEPEAVVDTSASQANGRVGSVNHWFILLLSMTVMLIWMIRLMRVKSSPARNS